MKIGVIGCGNMGKVLVKGMLHSIKLSEDIFLFDVDSSKAQKLLKSGKVSVMKSARDLIEKSDFVLLAIKPQDAAAFLKENAKAIDGKNKVLISIAAGLKTEFFREFVKKTPIARVMPNTPAVVGKAASAIYFAGKFTAAQKEGVLSIFQASGLAVEVKKEDWLDAVTGLSGSGPAYVFTFINSLADGAVLEGLPRDIARKLAVQTVLGSAELAASSLEEGVHLEELKDQVTSPGGTTAAGLYALEKGGFRASVIEAVREAAKRSRELGGK
jgi:pyrroline-5-carboxylate reductase